MGIFDKIFGRGAAKTVEQPNAQQRFNQLRQKYLPALQVADQQHVRLTTLQLQNDKLYFRGVAPSEEAKNRVWDQIKNIDADYSDLSADIVVRAAQPSAWGIDEATNKSYTVQSGDSLSKISKQFYGDPDEYMRIF